MANDDGLRNILDEIENYSSTLLAIISFVSIVTWDDTNRRRVAGSEFSIGRRMDRASAEEQVTPDIVIQKTTQLGYLVEAKRSFPRDNEHWKDVVQQLINYDNISRGWWTSDQTINVASVVLLLHHTRGIEVQRYLQETTEKGEFPREKPFSLVEFSRSNEQMVYMFLRRINWGEIEDAELLERLDVGVQVPVERVLGNPEYANLQFYDAEPPTEYMMQILWQSIFNPMHKLIERDEERKAWLLHIVPSEVTQELQRLYGSTGPTERDVAFPKVEWVEKAMEAFVVINLAERLDNKEYMVLFKRLRDNNIIERFSEFRHKAKPPKGEQPRLL